MHFPLSRRGRKKNGDICIPRSHDAYQALAVLDTFTYILILLLCISSVHSYGIIAQEQLDLMINNSPGNSCLVDVVYTRKSILTGGE